VLYSDLWSGCNRFLVISRENHELKNNPHKAPEEEEEEEEEECLHLV